ncbi:MULTISPECIES: amidohydrolase family protein [Pseudonocardia]|uniref:Dihydroorotase n=2 Tax=Pseudonocardia TaxID=1847 RepID=A0A1Y2MKF3_PSEAH|nr:MULTISPECIES: amidohydrolase family protein [Pseudonocardia]OSY35734.1 dihydroorotase [Pseudonocardia autotrophica]TDN74574.1 dihydroorotase [Pseudonocardia autotrophica]BBG05342.1 amidohydrolase [Pseudonocardia autotrophica]GEC27466.1 amidohydrolase [Pseudonocardia saturnea]
MHVDLLIKGGHVLDPGRSIDRRTDIAIADGRIAAIGDDLPTDGVARVVEVRAPGQYVVPGLLDIHTHVAHGAITPGVGMEGCDPDTIGVRSGVTTVLDAGSVGVANIGVFSAYIQPRARTRVIPYLNIGSYAHTMPTMVDVNALTEIDPDAIGRCVTANPGLVQGIKVRLVGPLMAEHGKEILGRSRQVAQEHGVPLMVHIGDLSARRRPDPHLLTPVTRYAIEQLAPGDVLTHLCTPNHGGVLGADDLMLPLLTEARERGVVLDAALGRGNFGFDVARRQRDAGLAPDTVSSDLTAMGESFQSLMECMAKFMAVGYSLTEVVRMTTTDAAAAIGKSDELGAIEVGREADLTILEVVDGDFEFVDTAGDTFPGAHGLRPVQTVRAGELIAPHWGPHPWGWLPAGAERS